MGALLLKVFRAAGEAQGRDKGLTTAATLLPVLCMG